jgi:AcrR family transcriptional regulator
MIDSNDPRAMRTRQKLVAAFHTAVAESDPAAMSVASLARTAGINRTSFYSHFSSPEDLAIHALSELLEVVGDTDILLRAEHSVPAEEATRRALRDIVLFVGERRDLYARVLGPGAAPRLLMTLTEAFTRRTVTTLAPVQARPAGADLELTARFLAAGLLGVLGSWLSGEPSRWSPDEVVEALVQCMPRWLNADAGPADTDIDTRE